MSQCGNSPLVSSFAGGVGGVAAAFATCPLEVIKTRLQSSSFHQPANTHGAVTHTRPLGTVGCFRHILKTEGFRSLYKGLFANVLGVAGSRGVYFLFYAEVTNLITRTGVSKDNLVVSGSAAACAGLVTQTVTAPVWFIKTRIQLSSQSGYTTMQCFQKTFRAEGFLGFFRGLSASYFGVVETVIKFALYEKIKLYLRHHHEIYSHATHEVNEENYMIDIGFAGGFSKIIATVCAYPHEVARTRLRQEEHGGPRKYRNFFQTLRKVYVEEGVRFGLYGGLGTQLVRQVPNSAIMFMVYEAMVSYFCPHDND